MVSLPYWKFESPNSPPWEFAFQHKTQNLLRNLENMPMWTVENVQKFSWQKQPSRGILIETFSGNMQQIYWRTSMANVIWKKRLNNFIEITLWHGCSPVHLQHIFRKPFPKNTSGGLLLIWVNLKYFQTSIQRMQCEHPYEHLHFNKYPHWICPSFIQYQHNRKKTEKEIIFWDMFSLLPIKFNIHFDFQNIITCVT